MSGKLNITVEKGATFKLNLTWNNKDGAGVLTPVDLTGFTARAQARADHAAAATLFSLTNGTGITLGGAAGTIAVVISAADTAAIVGDEGVWDLELVSGSGEVTRLVEGRVKFTPEVTK